DTGIVEGAVETPVEFHGRRDQCVGVRGAGDVASGELGGAALLANEANGLRAGFFRYVGGDYPGAFPREHEGCGATDSRCRTRDNRNLAVEKTRHLMPPDCGASLAPLR